MREIKFEFMWRNGKTGQYIKKIHTLEEIMAGDHYDEMSDNAFLRPYVLHVKRQSTSLKDKRGHELYEGDIINDEYCNMEIFWLEDEAMFVAGWPDEWYYLREQAACSTYVGNKYEHPELLIVED